MMENDEKDLYNRQAMSSEESNKAINKNEFMWWLASTIVIVVWGAFFTWMVTSLVDIRDGLLNFLVTFLMCIGSSVYMGAAIYGTHMLHPIRRSSVAACPGSSFSGPERPIVLYVISRC